jgi:hypothetical protein
MLKTELLPGLCRGEIQAAFALSEPGAGSDVRGLATVIRREGDRYLIDGEKKFITRGTTADWFVVVGRAEHDPDCFIAVLVPRNASGFMIGPEVGKLGWAGVPISSLEFRNVATPVANRLGQEGDGFDLAQDALVRARIGHAAMALGRAIGAAEIATAYMADRKLFGKSLGEHQGAQWMLAEMITRIEASRALVQLAAEKYDGADPGAGIFASMAKLQATDLGMKVVTDASSLNRWWTIDVPGGGQESRQCRISARNFCARAVPGRVKNSSGVPVSTMRPSSMNQTRSATSRAKPISCVTQTMVMPSLARPFITCSTSPTISGSSALVGSSNSITGGFIASARAMATRCCWPPDNWAG